jgi:hypothetical protein
VKKRRGWQHCVQVRRYARVEDKTIARISATLVEAVYDGRTEQISEDWAVEIADGEFVLKEHLGAVIETFDPPVLAKAMAEQPLHFAEMVANHRRIGRVIVTGQIAATMVTEYAPDFAVADPTVLPDGRLAFQVLQAPPPESDEPWRWRVLRVLARPESLMDPIQEQLFRRHSIR